jgi:hypothetical protein
MDNLFQDKTLVCNGDEVYKKNFTGKNYTKRPITAARMEAVARSK